MPSTSILTHLGLFVRRGFLDAESCRLIRDEMVSVDKAPALIRPLGQTGGVLDQSGRRTGVAHVSASTIALIEGRLQATMSSLASHFHVQLAGWQRPQFYIYEEGDFFKLHLDRDDDPIAPDWVRSRQVSVSILLNDERGGVAAEAYRGGTLVFHGHRRDLKGTAFEFPLKGEEGMFIAFPSDWYHEVRPVTSGRRYSIVTWFF
jgi:predicted 2-oxoglutarate/Fe(II)-dependent dioxygenase YbiX